MSKKFAVFDIDGTVNRWQFFHAMADVFAKRGFITPEEYAPVREARMTWKKRGHQESYREYEFLLVKAWLRALRRIPPAEFKMIAEEVFEKYKDQTYTYTRDLLRELKAKGYLLFVISGSPAEIVELFAGYYGFDDFVGVEHYQKAGRFTGEASESFRHKDRELQKLIEKHGVTLEGSVGVGDSSGDIEMLALVDRPIAFNPDQTLFAEAKARGWNIVVERKNVVYELEQRDGQIVLA